MQLPAATIRLSPTTGLNLYNDCQRCFWLQYRENITRPRGIFPSLPGGMDGVIKKYFDRFRGGLPPELDGKVEGTLIADQALLNRWRNWKTGLEYRDSARNAVLFGALDDCLVNASGQHVPLDYKTRGSAPRPGDSERGITKPNSTPTPCCSRRMVIRPPTTLTSCTTTPNRPASTGRSSSASSP